VETDFIFDGEAAETIFSAATQIAAAGPQRVVIPEGETVIRVPVTPGEVVVLPFGPEAEVLAKLGNGNLALKVGDVVVILEGYVAAVDTQPPVIKASDGTPLDIAAILAATDAALDTPTEYGSRVEGLMAANTGAIFQPFDDGGGIGGFRGVGRLDDSQGPHAVGPKFEKLTLHLQSTSVAAANAVPSVANFGAGTNEDTKVSGQLAGTDANGDPLSFHAVGTVPGLSVNANGSWSYDPAGRFDALAPGQQATVSFNYQANDGTADGNIATATVTITGVNDLPVLTSNVRQAQADEDAKGSKADLALFSGITDPDSSGLTFVVDGVAPVGITLDPNGILHFDPAGHYDALAKGETISADFHFKISDGIAFSNVQTIQILFTGVNDAPVAVADKVITNSGAVGFDIPEWALLANDKDVDSKTLDVSAVSGAVDSTVSHAPGSGNGGLVSFIDTAALGGSFSYVATDGAATSGKATVTVQNQSGGALNGTSGLEILVGSAAGEKINGGGGKDLIFGAGGDDSFVFRDGDTVQGGGDGVAPSGGLGAAAANRGDVFLLDHTLDMSNATVFGKSGGIETISLLNAETGAASGQTLTVTAASVTALSDHTITPGGLFSEQEAIRIDLDAADKLTLSTSGGGQWADTGIAMNGYEVFAHATAAGNPGNSEDAYVLVPIAAVGSIVIG